MRFFIEHKPENGIATVAGKDARHAAVLRVRTGDRITLCDGAGMDYDCTVERQSPEDGTLYCRVLGQEASQGEPLQRITLLAALSKGDKLESVIQKAVELGVSTIVPFLSQNCVSRPEKPEKKAARWQTIATEAAMQCDRGMIPSVSPVVPFEEAIQRAAESDTALFCYEAERQTGIRDILSGGMGKTVSLVTGPEGGFTPAEAEAAKTAGLVSVSLGSRILRCETAPVAALAVVLYAGGNM